MTWFFALLIVAVLGVVAVVASGRGGAMAETFDDRPDSRVQVEGPLTGDDLRRVRFSTAFRGYRMAEVDALLDRLSAELELAYAAQGHGPDAVADAATDAGRQSGAGTNGVAADQPGAGAGAGAGAGTGAGTGGTNGTPPAVDDPDEAFRPPAPGAAPHPEGSALDEPAEGRS